MKAGNSGWLAAWRWMLLALASALALAACGGGGGDGDGLQPQALEGTWRVSLREDGTTTTGGTVAASAVPTREQVAAINTSSVAQLLGSTSYSGYTVTLNGANLTITGPGTNLAVRINSVSTANYQTCRGCGVGAVVSYDMTVNITANGTINGSPVSGTDSGTVTVIYTRVT